MIFRSKQTRDAATKFNRMNRREIESDDEMGMQTKYKKYKNKIPNPGQRQSKEKRNMKCFICEKPGHFARHCHKRCKKCDNHAHHPSKCRKRKGNKNNDANMTTDDLDYDFGLTTNDQEHATIAILDSGASYHYANENTKGLTPGSLVICSLLR